MRMLYGRRLLALGLLALTTAAPALGLAQDKPKPAGAAGKAAPKAGGKAAPKKGGKKPAARKAGEPGEPDQATRRVIAGTAGRTVRESPELRAMRELDLALFPGSAPSHSAPWLEGGAPLVDHGEPRVNASGMPPAVALPDAKVEPARDLSWLRGLAMPDIPVRWDARVVRYLEYYKNNPRGHAMVQSWLRKSGRYGGSIRRTLREQNLPEDVLWLALVESGFDPTISSPAGAAGLWQFMPDGARIYGLAVDRWIDERLDPERSTLAAARYLSDLRQRFGSWELAFAAYNMGYGGLLAAIRKYNTNDFWELSRVESGVPLETALYVPKIMAMAIVARNKATFGCDDVELEPAVSFDKVAVSSGVSLQSIALAAGTSQEKVAELNPQLVASRTPPTAPGDKTSISWNVRVPPSLGPKAAKSLPHYADADAKLDRYVLRWGESLDDVAARHHTSRGMLSALNNFRRDESIRPGTVIFLPAPKGGEDPFADASLQKPVVVVPAHVAAPDAREGRKRVFYRVIAGDTLRELGLVLGVTPDDLSRWNAIDPSAALHEGMTLQAFTPAGQDLSHVLTITERDATVLTMGSPQFFTHFEGLKGRKRIEVIAKQGDTWHSIAQHHKLTAGQLERINGRARSSPLVPGDKVICYVKDTGKPGPHDRKPAKEEHLDDRSADVAVAGPVGEERDSARDESVGPASP